MPANGQRLYQPPAWRQCKIPAIFYALPLGAKINDGYDKAIFGRRHGDLRSICGIGESCWG
ncbi:hypothetical protein Dda3937_01377 [Dickeya dadantii 3937]|uniref:Uncharacterized protein n=1 Tax=Dickeya dadantii (strain 3937) TaxID=198628 RepID=E0SGC0_DICD3|nr:hypothetical protein Dda3937_01377 [Dickeya dadantii 3937]